MNQDDLKYSFEGELARASLYSDFNDINLYVEDTNKEYEYETVLKRLLGEKYSITTIFGLGGKQAVKKAFFENGEETAGKQNYYIVDGDFDRIISPEEMIDNSHFIYLKAYNIESYYIDEKACLKFAKGKLRQIDENVLKRIDFNEWKKTIVSQSSKLFLCYCFLKKYHPETESVNRKSCLFIDSKTGFERIDGAYQNFIKSVILPLDNKYLEKIKQIDKKYKEIYGSDYYNLICGKFLLDSLSFYLKSKGLKSFKHEDLRWSLINDFDIKKLDYIKETIINN